MNVQVLYENQISACGRLLEEPDRIDGGVLCEVEDDPGGIRHKTDEMV